jgi:purine nucleosidase
MGKKKIVLDVDAGVDDAMAIILATRSPELEVMAITAVSGNVHLNYCTKNVLRMLSLLGEELPVARGEEGPLKKELHSVPSIHGQDGLGDLGDAYYGRLNWTLVQPTPAVRFIPELIKKNPGEITIIATGPLTNIANAIQEDPIAMSQV